MLSSGTVHAETLPATSMTYEMGAIVRGSGTFSAARVLIVGGTDPAAVQPPLREILVLRDALVHRDGQLTCPAVVIKDGAGPFPHVWFILRVYLGETTLNVHDILPVSLNVLTYAIVNISLRSAHTYLLSGHG